MTTATAAKAPGGWRHDHGGAPQAPQPPADGGLTVASSTFVNVLTTVWLSGGAVGLTYAVTNRITTAGGRTDERTLSIVTMEK